MNTELEHGILEVPIEKDIEKAEEAIELFNSNELSILSDLPKSGIQKHLHHLSDGENQQIVDWKCQHDGPHGSRYHGTNSGGPCYWCYICTPSNPGAY